MAIALVLLLSVAVAATDFPGSASANDSSELLQPCSEAALQRPAIKHPLHMSRAGLWPHMGFPGEQFIGGALSYQKMPEDCAARYVRVSKGKLQMVRRGRWVSICGNCVGWYGSKEGTMRMMFAPPHPDIPADALAYNSCGPDGGFRKVSIWVVNMLKRPATGATEAVSKKFRFPVAVRGNCQDAALSARRVHKLWRELYG